MQINWNRHDRYLEGSIDKSANITDTQLAFKISSITRMTDEEIVELFPHPTDAKKLEELMKIVQSADARNKKIDKIFYNAEDFGGIILTLLGRLT